jgi:hypothetical protein
VELHRFRIAIRGHLSERFAARFDGLAAEASDGVTTLTGDFGDQAQLYGLLEHIADCGLELAGVEEVVPDARSGQRHRGDRP